MTLHTNTFRLNKNITKNAPHMFNYDQKLNTENLNVVTEKILEFYDITVPISDKQKTQLVNLLTDLQFTHPVHLAATSHAKKGNNVYTYLYTYKGEYSFVKVLKGENFTEEYEEMGNSPLKCFCFATIAFKLTNLLEPLQLQ